MSVLINASTSTGLVQSADTSGEIELQSNGTTALKVNTNEGIQILNCLGVGNATPSTSGAGITFPATQSASSDANTLDDYEEGTFTPVMGCTSSNPTVTYSNQIGRYTKIGRLVYIRLQLDNISAPTGTLTNQMTITGLPFTAAAGIGYGASLAVGFEVYIDYPAGVTNIQARVIAGASYIELRFTEDDGGGVDFLASNFDWSDARIALSGCYEV